MNIRYLIAAACAAILPFSPAISALAVDAHGWTMITPSADSRVVYVSSTDGNDSNNGLSPESPKATIAAGNALIRDGYPDHLLLKRGDVFTAVGSLGRWKSGRSVDEPLVLSHYGDSGPRPVVELTGGFIDHNGLVRNYQSIIGIDFYKPTADPHSGQFNNSDGSTALRFLGGGENIRVEDCRLRFCGVVIQSWTDAEPRRYTNFEFRRNIVTDHWVHNSFPINQDNRRHTNGIYMSGVHGYLMEEN